MEFEVRIIKGTKRVGEVFTVKREDIKYIHVSPASATANRFSIKITRYVIDIDGFDTILDPMDCEIVTNERINILAL